MGGYPTAFTVVPLRYAWLAAGLLLAACYEPFPPSNVPCTDEGSVCPTGQSCVRGTCRALSDMPDGSTIPEMDGPTPDGTPADLDGDMIPNATDNCRDKHNPDQHDEDKDAVGDVCDNCPHIANTNQANTGEGASPDGVGDACDPRPALPGDTIARFYSFHVPPAGTTTQGTWTVDGDSYRFGGGEGSLIVTGVRDKVVIDASGTLDQAMGDVVIVATAGEANGRYHNCGYYDCEDQGCGGDPTDFHTALIEYYNGQDWIDRAGNHNVNQRLSGSFTIRFAADSTTDRLLCTTSDLPRGPVTSQYNNAGDLVPGALGLRSEFAAYRLHYLVVFAQQ